MSTKSTLGEAWRDLVAATLNGERVVDPTGDYLECEAIEFAAHSVDVTDPIVARFVPRESITNMSKVFRTSEANAFGHSYGSVIGPQLGGVVSTLRLKPSSRKAVVALAPQESFVPCINAIHFYLRGDQLQLTYFSRGQDLWNKFCPDALAMRELQAKVAAELGGISLGSIRGFISSAHVYLRDLEAAQRLIVHDEP